MTKELARYLTVLIANDIDTKSNGIDMSSYECEQIELAFLKGNFADIEVFIKGKLSHKKPEQKECFKIGKIKISDKL